MADLPYIPLFTDAYMADCGHLTDAEHGVYLQILILLWRTPMQRIPDDVNWIARKFRRSVEESDATVVPVLREFCESDGNWWTQKRLSAEFAKASKTSKRQSDAAKSRWRKNKDASHGNAERHTSGNAPTTTTTTTPIERIHTREGFEDAHKDIARNLIQSGNCTDWEKQFLGSIATSRSLSRHQRERFDAIVASQELRPAAEMDKKAKAREVLKRSGLLK
jgi:uncharacterized protein YdaU (DUF1376 family)